MFFKQSSLFVANAVLILFIFLQSGSALAVATCENNEDCDDGKACTVDLCNSGTCENITDDLYCSDGYYCNGEETCDPDNPEALADGCAQGLEVDCSSGLPECVSGECNETTNSCDYTADNAVCDDLDGCNGIETCEIGTGCVAGNDPCVDEWACTTNICTDLGSNSYECSYIAENNVCADELWCNGEEICAPGDAEADPLGCIGGVAPDCVDEYECTVDSCDEQNNQCSNIPNNGYCDDTLFCTGVEFCNPSSGEAGADGCVAGTAVDCDDGVGCTDDTCDEDQDVCINTAENSNCDDLNPCTGPDTCHELNDCYNPYLPDYTSCTLSGGGPGICKSGVCTTGCATDNDCDDGVACTEDTCDTENETCIYTATDSNCDDDLWCNGAETCVPGDPSADADGCLLGAAPVCNDQIDCTDDSCNEVDDRCDNIPDDGQCDDTVWCNGAEYCDVESGCMDGVQPCDDGVSCTDDSCTESTHDCANYVNDDNCDDGLWCNGEETCDLELDCQAGVVQDCNDSVNCTEDSCDEDNDQCINVAEDGNCEDYNDCTSEYCDVSGDCQSSNVTNGSACQLNPFVMGVCSDGVCQETCTFDEDCPAPACVTAVCDGGLCKFTNDDFYCNDFDVCNGVEECNPNHPDAGSDGCVSSTALDCDDGIACTVDTCNSVDGCENTPDNSACGDSNACNGEEVCDSELGCQPGVALDCDDSVSCTVDSCDESSGCVNTPDNSACSDDQWCNGEEICDETAGCQDGADPDCSDDFSCTVDSCDETQDVCRHQPDNSSCDDDLYCNGSEMCSPYDANADAAGCVAGTAVVCDDDIDCTSDECDEQNDNCYHAANNALCDNGDFCDGNETCVLDVGCVDGTQVQCDDEIPCTVDACNEVTDQCDFTPDNGECDDGLWCNGPEYCSEYIGCYQGEAPVCTDTYYCTADSCDEVNDRCLNEADDSKCIDSSICNGDEVCNPSDSNADQLGCVAGDDVVCSDEFDCTSDYCDDGQGGCVFEPNDNYCSDDLSCNGTETCSPLDPEHMANGCVAGEEVVCSDGIDCTVGTCVELTPSGYYCDHEPYDSLCANDDLCDGVETCSEIYGCQDGVAVDCNDFVDCTDDDCNPATGGCSNIPNDTNCSDSNPCQPLIACHLTEGCQYDLLVDDTPCDINSGLDEHCLNGYCVPVGVECQNNEDCNDQIECTNDVCDNDVCVYYADSSLCQDDTYCNGEEICVIGSGCQDGPDPDCSDGVSCTRDQCEEATSSCSHTPVDNWCDDGKFCNGVEVCHATNDCQPGTPVVCPDDGISCTVEDCNEGNHQCESTPNDSLCQDGLYCNGAEVCDQVQDCRPGVAPVTDDGVGCTVDTCDEGADTQDNIGQIVHTADNASCQDGLYCNGTESCDLNNDCQPGTAISLSDGVDCTIDSCDEGANVTDNLGTVLHAPDNDSCQDGLYCNGVEFCDEVNDCQSGEAVSLSDNVDCTVDTCDEGENQQDNLGQVVHTPDNDACQDGLYCNGAETCDLNNDCQPGVAPDLSDGVECTDDSCDEGQSVEDNLGEIVHTPNNFNCIDQDLCNGEEWCHIDNDCQPGVAVVCNDDIDCTEDACIPDTGECDFVPDDDYCDDSLVCTIDFCDDEQGCINTDAEDGISCDVDPGLVEVCSDGVCVKGCNVDEDCADEFDCTSESCNTETFLCVIDTDDSVCDNEIFCDGAEICNPELGCQDGTAPSCDDGFACTTGDWCDPELDECSYTANDSLCNDDEECTTDICTVGLGCANEKLPDDTECNGGLWLCLDGVCVEPGTDGDLDTDDAEPDLEPDAEIELEIETDGDLEPDVEIDGDDEMDDEIDRDIEVDGDDVDGDEDQDEDSDIPVDGDKDDDTDGDKDEAIDGDEDEVDGDETIDGDDDESVDGDDVIDGDKPDPDGDDSTEDGDEGDIKPDGDEDEDRGTVIVPRGSSSGGCSTAVSTFSQILLLLTLAGLVIFRRREKE